MGDLRIVDVRIKSAVMNEISAQGLDIDQGMVLKMGEQLYYGSDVLHTLALIGSRSGLFNRFNYWMLNQKQFQGFFIRVSDFLETCFLNC